MSSRARSASGPRRLDAHQLGKVKPATLAKYRCAGAKFLEWLERYGFEPESVEEFDDLLVDYKNSEKVTRAHFEQVVAAVEFAFPRYRGGLAWAHAVLRGWHVAGQTKHATPLGRGPAAWIGATWASQGEFRLGLAVFVPSSARTQTIRAAKNCSGRRRPPLGPAA